MRLKQNFHSHLSQRTILDVLTIRRWNFVRSSWNFNRRFLSYRSSICLVGLLIRVLQKRQKFCEVLLTAANFCQCEYLLFQQSLGENISDSSEIFTGASDSYGFILFGAIWNWSCIWIAENLGTASIIE